MRSAFLFACIAPASAFVATAPLRAPVQARSPAAVQMAAAADDFVPDLQRRTIMNLILLGGAGVPVLWLGGGFVYFFVPPSGGGGGGGIAALDAKGDAVTAADWAKANRGPAPLSLALAHLQQPDGKVFLTPWTETDF